MKNRAFALAFSFLLLVGVAPSAWAVQEPETVPPPPSSGPVSPAPAGPLGSASSTAKPALPTPFAHIHDTQVFAVKVARGGHSAADRAQHASEVLEHAAEDAASGDVRVEEPSPDVAILYLADAPVIQLGPEDAAANGDASVAVHAAVLAGRIDAAVRSERKRNALATTVFAASLLVFSALIVFLVLGKLGGFVSRGREWVVSRPSTLPNMRIAGIDVVRPTALRSVALAGIDGSTWILRLGLVYGWLLFALSLFDVTRPYSARLTGFVVAPLYGFISRLASTTPVLIIGGVAAIVVLLALRVIALFFEGVARGEPALSWLPQDLAEPTSLLLRIGLVVVAASVATPLITGNEKGPLADASFIAIGAIALAVTPVMASAVVGVTVLFGRRVRIGEFVELGGRFGVVRAVRLLGVSLEDHDGCLLRVPHLSSLLHPTRLLGSMPPVVVELRVTADADVEAVTALLSRVAGEVGLRGRVELTDLHGDAAVYSVTVLSSSATARSELLTAAAKALKASGIALGRPRDRGPVSSVSSGASSPTSPTSKVHPPPSGAA